MTGAGGFIGSHLAADQSLRGRKVVALDLDLSRIEHLRKKDLFELVRGDVADPDIQRRALRGVDTAFHLAAAHLGVTAGEKEFWRVNVEGVRSLVQASQETGIQRFVHCSSVGVYGRVDDPPADENSPCRPDLVYEKTKLAGEEEVLRAVREKGFPAVILRPAWVYGPGCPRTEKLFRSIQKGYLPMAGRGEVLRHCIYIRDMLEAFDLAATAPDAEGEVIIIGDARAVPVRRLLEEIARLVGSPPPRSVSIRFLHIAALLAEMAFQPRGKEPPLSRRTLKFFTNQTAFDISKARRILCFEPHYDLRTGLVETHRILTSPLPWRVPLPDCSAM